MDLLNLFSWVGNLVGLERDIHIPEVVCLGAS